MYPHILDITPPVLRASGYPSSVVMIEAGVPGMRSSVAVTNPPLTLPTYIDTNRTNACSPLIEKVNGNESAINIAPVNPGIAPTETPRIDPIATSASEAGESINLATASSSDINLLWKLSRQVHHQHRRE